MNITEYIEKNWSKTSGINAVVKSGRKLARLMVPRENKWDVWLWNESKAISPKLKIRGDGKDASLLADWSPLDTSA
jgi:hypothetical protein